MEGSGHLTGHHVTASEHIDQVVAALRCLGEKEHFQQKYAAGDEDSVILFPVGDGNHSLATAKRCWEMLRAAGADHNHPARYALVELVNIHDPGLDFHPIHRLVESICVLDALTNMENYFRSEGWDVSFHAGAKLSDEEGRQRQGVHKFECVSKEVSGVFTISQVTNVLEVKTLDLWLNSYLQEHCECQLDYVHEVYTVEGKAKTDETTLGFLLPSMDKNDLVKTVVKEGMLPRKTFSMGHAPEKRFYCECRQVSPALL